MKSIQATLEWMGSRFLIAGFIPALGFINLLLFAFNPILPNAISRRLGGPADLLQDGSLVMLIASVALGFTMTVLSNFLVKIFEGYIVLEHFPFLKQRELKREYKLRCRINQLQKSLDYYRDNEKMDDPSALRINAILNTLIVQHEMMFPFVRREIMPTSFGNLLKAAECYSAERYHIDSVVFWPSLVHVIAPSYNLCIQETRNQLSFVVNCSFLSILFGALCWGASLYQAVLRIFLEEKIQSPLYFIQVNLPARVYEERVVIYFIIGVVAFLIAFSFYRASLISVSEFCGMIRSSYDLFRFDLLKALHIELPKDSRSERTLWYRIGDLVKKGYSWEKMEPLPFTYYHETQSQNDQ